MSCQHVLARKTLVDPDGAVSAHTDVASTPHAAPLARIFLREQLRDHVDLDTLKTAELLTTELITNVVLHARTPIHLGVTRDAHALLVTVQDRDPAGPVARHQQTSPDDLEFSGRGLQILASLADDYGWEQLTHDVGKVAWFVLALPASADVPGQRHPRGQ